MKKFISIILCCAFLFACVCIPSSAAEGKTVLYLNYGDITVDEYGICGYDINGEYVYDDNPLGYVITQKNPKKTIDKGITVSSGKCSIELLNLNIKRFDEYNCAFSTENDAEVTVTLTGENHLVSGTYRAGLEVGIDSTVTVNGDGTLYAQSSLQAGIGGGNGQSNGMLVIDSGTIYATGGIDGYSAGIGGGSSGSGGSITINGGYICATGGMYASGIGGGFMCGGNITVNGGVVTAIGGAGGAGIGGGYLTNGVTDVVINGGSVKAVAGTNADSIGNGYKTKTAFAGVHDSDGNTVSLVTLSVGDFRSIYVNGIDTVPMTVLHPDDDKLYLYAGSAEKIVTVYMNDGSVNFFKVTDNGVTQLYPYAGVRCEDRLITDGSVTVADGFSVSEDNDLIYNSLRVDAFTPALRGDMNFDGSLNSMDAVIINCVVSGMLTDNLTVKLSDADGNGTVNSDDADLMKQYGVGGDNR